MDLKGKTAIVTGAGSGIGRALAEHFAAAGASVVCVGRRLETLQETVASIESQNGKAMAITADVTDQKQVQAMVDKTLATWGQIDVLFNNAGSFAVIGGLWEVDPDAWWQDVTVNLRGPMLTSHAVLPDMMKRNEGIIINMDGGGSTSPLTGGSAYGSSKAALLRMTDTLARELEHEGSNVLVMAMGPGLVHTAMTQLQADSPLGRKWIPSTAKAIEAGNTREPDQCAKATLELLKHACPAFNGRCFGVGTNFAERAQNAETILEKDLHVMRMRSR